MTFVPLDPHQGEPLPDKAIRPRRRTPLTQELPAGDYLVVAVLDDGRFHEVYRRVPKETESLGGIYGHLRWDKGEGQSIRLPGITIPDEQVTHEMALIQGTVGDSDFYIDCHEFTVADYRRVSNGKSPLDRRWRSVPDEYAVTVDCNTAIALAEIIGKRLPTEHEFACAVLQREPQRISTSAAGESQAAHDIGPAGWPSEDRTHTSPAVFGLCSNVAEWTISRSTNLLPAREAGSTLLLLESRERLVCGGDPVLRFGKSPTAAIDDLHLGMIVPENTLRPGLGFRCVRSSAPRFIDE